MHYVAIASVIRWTIFAVGVFLFVRAPEQSWIVPLVEGAAVGGQAVFYFRGVARSFGPARPRLDRPFALAMFRQALPVGASEWVWAIKVYFATVWLGMFVGGPEVGWFGAAHRIVISLHTFVWLYFFNLLPSMSRCTQKPIDALRHLLRSSMQVTAWSAVFLGIVGTAFAEPLVALLYGEQYRQATAAFQWLIWLIPLTLLHGHYRYALIAYDRQRLEFLATAFGAGLNVVLSLLLIPAYGLTGAAWALVASELFIGGLAYYYVRRTIAHIPILPSLYRPLLAGAVLAGVLCVLSRANVWLAGGSAVTVYGLMLVIVQPKMLRDVRSVFARGG
jgi:O-antigen/teichoic acid export membrane protein